MSTSSNDDDEQQLFHGIKGKGIGTPYPAYRHASVFRESEGENRDNVYGWIENTHPNRTYLELFATPDKEPRKGWTRG